MEGVGASVDELLDEFGDLSPGSPLLGQTLDLLLGWDLSGEEEPEETLWQGLLTTWGGWEFGLALGDGQASESDTLVGIEDGTLPNQTLQPESIHLPEIDGRLRPTLIPRIPP